MRWLAIVALCGCLSEPDRPHGLGPPIAAGSVLRHRTAVADLNGDGYDDLVVWGNEGAAGVTPTVFVYFGGELLENPDLRADLTVVDPKLTARWYETLDASAFISADGSVRGIAALSAQDSMPPPRNSGLERLYYFSFLPIVGHSFGPWEHTASGPDDGDGGYAPSESQVCIFERDTVASLPARQLVASGEIAWALDAPVSLDSAIVDAKFPAIPGQTNYVVQQVLELPPSGPSEDLLVISDRGAFRTQGDAVPSFAAGTSVALPVSNRYARGRATGDHFDAVTNNTTASQVNILEVPGTGDPVVYTLATNGQADDLAIADVGGDSRLDVVALESGTLGIYRDVTLGEPTTVDEVFGSRDALPGYDLLAVGNFHGDAQLEIYVLDSADPTQPILCYRLSDAHTLARCTDE